MFEKAFTFLGFQLARFQFRSDVDHVQPLAEFMRTARNVLIIMPIGYEDAVHAGKMLAATCKELKNLHLTVVHTSTRETPLTTFPHCEVVRLDPSDITKFSLPRRSLLQRIFQKEFDVAMDLNLDFVLHTAYICKASHARVRIGCTHAASDIFYNVQLNLNKQHPPQVLYQKFANYVAMF